MDVTDESLTKFQRWLRRRGRAEGTADSYMYQVARCAELDDPLERLLDPDLSPKYIHTIAAALKSWARFSKDGDLELELAEIKLPAAKRVKEKSILTREDWSKLREEINRADYISEPVRAELGMMASRGFRRGDILRLRKSDIAGALKSGTLVYEAKGRRRLAFPISSHWGPYLELLMEAGGRKKWERVCDLVSPGSNPKTRMDTAGKTITRSLSYCGEEVGIEDIHPHLLRRTYATFYYEACQDPVKLKDHMQWANIETAMLYVAASNQEELEAVADTLFS